MGSRLMNSHKPYVVAQGFLAVPPRLKLFQRLMDDIITMALSRPRPIAGQRVAANAEEEEKRLNTLFGTKAAPTMRFHANLEAQAGKRLTRAGPEKMKDHTEIKWELLQEWCENQFWTGSLWHRVPPPRMGNTMCGGRWSH